MCLIIRKKPSFKYDQEFITKCIKNSAVKNNGGFGFAIRYEKHILVKKGYKSTDSFIRALKYISEKEDLDKRELLIHLRNASPGTGTNLETTHPIIANDEENGKKRNETTNAVFVHNGYLNGFRTDISISKEDTSDTLEFVRKFLTKENSYKFMIYMLDNFNNKFNSFYNLGNNKIVIMKAGESTILSGWTIDTAKEGYEFSNDSFKDTFPHRFQEAEQWNDSYQTRKPIPNPNASGSSGSQYYVAQKGNSGLYKDYSRNIELTLELDDPYSEDKTLRFFYRSIALHLTLDNEPTITGITPFSCHTNSTFKHTDCFLTDSISCCKQLVNEKSKVEILLRAALANFVSKREYEHLTHSDKMKLGSPCMDVLKAIDVSRAHPVEWYWTECTKCSNKESYRKATGTAWVKKEPICEECQGLKAKLGLFMDIAGNGMSNSFRHVDFVKIETNHYQQTQVESINIKKVFIPRLLRFIKARIVLNIDDDKKSNTEKSTSDVSGE